MLKSFTTLLMLLTFTLVALADEQEIVPINPLKVASKHYIFEERAPLFSEPSVDSASCGTALIGQQVEIIKRVDKIEVFNKVKAYWYRVKIDKSICYIWGGMLSTLAIKADFDRDGRDELLLSRTMGEGDLDNMWISYDHNPRLCRVGELITTTPFSEELPYSTGFDLFADKGFEPEVPLLEVYRFMADGGGSVYWSDLYYWSEGAFQLITTTKDTTSLSYQDRVSYIFPSNKKKGKSNTLRLERRFSKYDSSISFYMLRNIFESWNKEYLWDGKSFKEIK